MSSPYSLASPAAPPGQNLAVTLTLLPILGLGVLCATLDVPHAWMALFVIATLLYSVFFWPVVRLGLPWAAAAVAGEPVIEQFEMRTDPHPKRARNLSCTYGLRGGPLPEPVAPGSRLCITSGQCHKFPDAPVTVTLSGDRTAWGMRIEKILAIEASAEP